jgi:hypothetical protein
MQMLPAGLGLAAMLVLPDWSEGMWDPLQLRQVGRLSPPWAQLRICAALALGLAFLGGPDALDILARRKRATPSPQAQGRE